MVSRDHACECSVTLRRTRGMVQSRLTARLYVSRTTFFYLTARRPPRSTLFPYTTLFRSFPRSTAQRTRYSWSGGRALGPKYLDRKSHTSELQSLRHLVCRLLLEKKKNCKQRPNFPTVKRGAAGTYLASPLLAVFRRLAAA